MDATPNDFCKTGKERGTYTHARVDECACVVWAVATPSSHAPRLTFVVAGGRGGAPVLGLANVMPTR